MVEDSFVLSIQCSGNLTNNFVGIFLILMKRTSISFCDKNSEK